MAVMNVSTYAFTVLAAHLLGPKPYGAFASLMATLLVISVVQLGLQATAARRISAEPEHAHEVEAVILRVTYWAAGLFGVLLLLLSPLLDHILRLGSIPTAALVAVAAVPLTVMGGQAGILQGERRWRPLGAVYIAAGVPRVVIGLVLIAWSPTEASAMLGVTIATFAPVVVGWWALRHPRPSAGAVQRHHPREVVREVVHNSQALLAFFALSNVDVIVARNVLPAHDAGLYAGGLIMTKAVLFLPQFVVVLAFPAMSTVAERRYALTRSLAVVAFLGLSCTVVALGFPQLALIFVGGAEYQDIADLLWLFALLGTVLSMLQLVIYAVLARQGRRSTLAVWVALVALVGIGATTSSVVGLLVAVMAVDTLLFLLLTGVTLRLIRSPEEQELASTSPS